ncbi:MAG: site-specific integrase [Proteobacteria bacterium]|nr:site-specific integrase [Pseudomonadota bacterium]
MSARRYKNSWWCDFRFEGERYRRKSPVNSRRGAEKYERELIRKLRAGLPIDQSDETARDKPARPTQPAKHSIPPDGKEVPTFAAFAQEFMNTYAKANNKLSEQLAKQSHLTCHLLPAFGTLQLSQIDTRQVETFKAALLDGKRSRKRVNNILATLGTILRYAVEIDLLIKPPKIKLLKTEDKQVRFLDFSPYETLIRSAEHEPLWHAAILLGGDAGLRLGEIRALKATHWNRKQERITVERSLSCGVETSTKGWKRRTIPLTRRLQAALEALATMGHAYLVSRHKSEPLTMETTRWHLPKLCRKAGVEPIGWHALRHTFCSHLAMMGVPARTIQELAGHADLTTTLKYMHLVPGETDRAIGLLDQRRGQIEKFDPDSEPSDEPLPEPNDDP